MSRFNPQRETTQIKVGAVVIIAILVLLLSYSWLSDYLSFTKHTELNILFSDINKLEPGDDVLIYGMKRGRVRGLTLKKEGVVVTVNAELDFDLPEDTEFIIKDSNLMGSKVLEIVPGKSKKKLNSEILLNGSSSLNLSSAINEAAIILPTVEKTLLSINHSLEDFQNILSHIDSFLVDNRFKLEDIIENTIEVTNNVNSLIVKNSHKLEYTLDSSAKLIDELTINLSYFQKLIHDLQDIAEIVNDESGTFGRIMKDPSVYENLLNLINSADSLVSDIKENPRKYIRMSIF